MNIAMNVLIISDDPERKSFAQILGLKRRILKLDGDVDLLVFSNKGIFLNRKKVRNEKETLLELFRNRLSDRSYAIIVVSLKKDNLKKFCTEKQNILDLIMEISPQSDTFVFGGSSVLSRIEKSRAVNHFLYRRPGVSKLTEEFRNDLINHIKMRMTASYNKVNR